MPNTAIPPPKGAEPGKERLIEKLSRYEATSELMFVILPFIVIGITLSHKKEMATIFSLPEWSLVSAVVVGQSIVRLVSMAVGRRKILKQYIVLILSVVLVTCLVPILVVLSMILLTTGEKISWELALAQMAFFILSIAIYWCALFVEAHARMHPED